MDGPEKPACGRQAKSNRVMRPLLIGAGTLCVALGTLGILLPLLPTTPFLLLAAWCYARSSRRFHLYLLTNRWFGGYIHNYRAGRGMPLKQKVFTLLLLWLTVGYSAWRAVDQWWLRLVLLGIAFGVTLHLLRIRTLREADLPCSGAEGSVGKAHAATGPAERAACGGQPDPGPQGRIDAVEQGEIT